VLYYLIYNPEHWKRDTHEPFEVYHLEKGEYVRQLGSPVWMPEIRLGIDCEQGVYEGWTREWLYWFDQSSNRLPTPVEVAQQEHQWANQEQQKAERETATQRRPDC